MNEKSIKPKSTIPPLTGYLGLITIIAWSLCVSLSSYRSPFNSPLEECVVMLLTVFAVMAFYEAVFKKSYAEKSAGINFSGTVDVRRCFGKSFVLKMLGLCFSLGLVGAYYTIADLYRGDWYVPFFYVLSDYAGLIAFLLILYFSWVHILMDKPNDSYWEVGRFVLSFGREGDRAAIRDHFLAMAVKAFFLPLMFCSFYYDWLRLKGFDWSGLDTPREYYEAAFGYLMFIDVAFTVVGYVFSMRLLNAHIRWTERTAGGWFFCLMCYIPFWQIFGRNFLNYHDGGVMWSLSENFPILAVLWGAVVILLMIIYSLSTVHFGLRFSNLTYRGLITHGTYSFTKHPAYVSKNISWWMISTPFFALDWGLAVKNSVTLLGVNYIYYRRAKYEEKCLSESSEYREYVTYMNEHSIFSMAKIRRFLRLFKKT